MMTLGQPLHPTETECGYCFITIKILPFKGTKVRDV